MDFNDAISILIKSNFKALDVKVSSEYSEIRNKIQFNLASNFLSNIQLL